MSYRSMWPLIPEHWKNESHLTTVSRLLHKALHCVPDVNLWCSDQNVYWCSGCQFMVFCSKSQLVFRMSIYGVLFRMSIGVADDNLWCSVQNVYWCSGCQFMVFCSECLLVFQMSIYGVLFRMSIEDVCLLLWGFSLLVQSNLSIVVTQGTEPNWLL